MKIKNYFSSVLKSQHVLPIAIIIVGVFLANSLYLSGKANPNPLLQRSDLATNVVAGKLGGRNTIDPNDGFTTQALGHLAAKDWLKGAIPYWNHYEGVGTPLAGEMQVAAFFPPVLLVDLTNGLLYFHLLLEVVAGITTYYLIIKLKLDRRIAVFGGLAFALNGTFAWLTNAPFNPIAFLPLLLLGIELAYQSSLDDRKRGWLLITIAVALSLYAGFPEVAFINGLLGLAWATARFFQLHNPQLRKNFTRKFITGGLVGVVLAAPVLVSFYGYIKYANVGIHSSASTFGIVPAGLSSLFMPYIFGPIFGQFNYDASGQLLLFWSRVGGYITASLIVLALYGVMGKRDRLLKRVLAGWTIATVLGTYGLLRIMYVLNLIPGVSSTAFYRYAVPSFELSIVILAAFGIAELTDNKQSKRARVAVAGIIGLILVAGVINAIPEIHRLSGAHHSHLWLAFSILAAVGSVVLIFVAQLIKDKRLRQWALISVALFEIFVMFMIPTLSTPRHQQLDTQPVSFLQSHLGQYRYFTLGPIQPNYGSYYQIASININDVPIPKDWSDYINKNLNQNVNPLIFTGANPQNINGPSGLDEFITNFTSYEEVGVKYLVAPEGFVQSRVIAELGMKKVFTSPSADIFELPNPKPYFEASGGNCSLTPNGKDFIDVSCSKPALLVRREQFMKGWQASVNTRPANIVEYGHLFQAISVPAGTSEISYYYSPPHIAVAYVAMLLGIVGIAVGYIPTSFEKHKVITKKQVRSQTKRLK